MKKLYIYGDSFSDFYMRDKVKKFWFEIVADYFNLHLVHRAVSGYGWQRINHLIFKDVHTWGKQDLIIICPSYFTRVDIVDFSIDRPSMKFDEPWIVDLDSHFKREAYTMENWYNTIRFFKKQGYNVHTWALDKVYPRYRDIFMKPPVPHKSWYDWILSDPEHWVIPYPHPGGDNGEIIERDTHFSTIGSIRIADHFICYLEDEKIQGSNLL